MKKKPQELFRLAREALLRAGAHEAMAGTAAQHLVRAEEQGLPTHGMSRVPFYCSMLRSGRADGRSAGENREAMYDVVVGFPKMKVAVATRDGRVAGIHYLPPGADLVAPANALAERAARQLERYREDPDAKFDLPLLIEGTQFQRRLWGALCDIPRGRTLTYGELARKLGGEARAVGQACGDNKLPIVIPCHRVVAAGGIGGFAHATDGYLIEAKRWLLLHESSADAFQLAP